MARKNLPAVLAIPRLGFDLVLCGERSAVRGEHLIDLGFLRHEDMPRLYGCVDLLVHAAVDEGFPLAVQEAMACGLPVALLWDPGYGAALEPDAVAASDSLSQLAGTVAALVRDPEERARLGRRARAHAERHWSWAAAAGAYLDLYREAMAART